MLRFYSVHLDHVDSSERLAQIAALRAIALDYGMTGGAISGTAEVGFPELPASPDLVLAGDFNLEPGSPDYLALTGDGRLVDASRGDDGWSWTDPAGVKPVQRLDYAFANPELAARIISVRIDRQATGSDHMPLWFTIA